MFQTEHIEKIETFYVQFFFSENRAVYEMWEKVVQPDKQQKTIQYGGQNIRFAYRITKARIQTHTPNT
jgi:transcription antitermination factor NusA-like protein